MPQILLHIGQMKTGTTTLQAVLHRERTTLAKSGILYPTSNIDLNRHCQLAWSCWPPKSRSGWAENKYCRKPTAQILDELTNEIDAATPDRVILSAEEFSLRPPHCFKPVFDAFAPDLTVYVYLRRQDEMLQSMYKQNVEGMGITDTFADYLQNALAPQSILGNRINYQAFLENWERAIGRDRLRPLIYDKTAKASIVDHFLSASDIQVDIQATAKRHNPSLEGGYLEFVRQANAYLSGPSRAKVIRGIKQLARSEGAKKTDLCSPQDRERIADHYAGSNRQVAQLYFGRENLFLD